MSETEHKTGTLTPVPIIGSVENTCQLILEQHDEEKCKFSDSFREQFEDWGYRHYIVTDNAIYKVTTEDKDPYDDIAIATENEDGSIDFEIRFYNGGCSFSEAVEVALNNLR